MRIHNLLIAGALAGLMANATPARAIEVNSPVHHAHAMKPHKHAKKNGSEKHIAVTKDGRTRSAGGTVSKELMGKSSRPSVHKGISGRRFSKHHVKSSNASSHKSGRSSKSTSKNYQ